MEERLRKFAVLVDAGNFTRAAATLHLSQPALTVAVNKLERELGGQLLVRGSRGFRLTAAGQLAYTAAKELGTVTANLALRLRDSAGQQPRLAIGLIDSLAGQIFNSQMEVDKFESLLQLSVTVTDSATMLRAVRRDEIDIAFVTEPSVAQPASIIVERLGVEPLVLVCRPDLRFGYEQQATAGEALSFISYIQGSTSHDIIQVGLSEQAIRPAPVFYSSSPEVMLELVLRGKGVAVLPYFLVKSFLKRQRLAALRVPSIVIVDRPIASATRRGKLLPAAASGLPILLQNMLAQQFKAASKLD